MHNSPCATLLLLPLLLSATHVCAGQADESSEDLETIVRTARRATALVLADGSRSAGSACCISQEGFVIATYQSVERSQKIELVFSPGELNELRIPARIVRADRDQDLALLKVDSSPDLTSLVIDVESPLLETSQVTVFSFPRAAPALLQRGEFPPLNVLVARISSLAKAAGVISSIGIDAPLAPGNSGGPLLSSTGGVIGIVASARGNATPERFIPARRVMEFLDSVEIEASVPATVQVGETVTIEARPVHVLGPLVNPDLQLEFSSSLFTSQNVPMTTEDGKVWTASFAPAPHVNSLETLGLVAEYPNSAVHVRIPGGNLIVDDSPVPLAEIASIERSGDHYSILRSDETRLTATLLSGLPTTVNIGSRRIDLDLYAADRIAISTGVRPVVDVTITLSASAAIESDERIVIRRADTIAVPERGGQPETSKSSLMPRPPDSDWWKLGETPLLPEYLTATGPVVRGREGGLRFEGVKPHQEIGGPILITRDRDFLNRDFLFEVLMTFGPEDRIANIGIGSGTQEGSANRRSESIFLRFHAPGHGRGEIQLQHAGNASGQTVPTVNLGHVPHQGPHRVCIRKQGNAVSFSVDPENDGPSDDDLETIIPDLHTVAPYLHSKNTNIFLGGTATYIATRLEVFP